MVAFVCVWVAGCDIASQPAPVARAEHTLPAITLTYSQATDRAGPQPPGFAAAAATRTTQPSASPAPGSATASTAHPQSRITTTPVAITLDAPVCTPSPGGLTCLGLVRNPLSTAVQRVVLRASLVSPDGRAVASVTVAAALSRIPPDGVSPYRAIFAGAIPADYSVQVAVVSADTAPESAALASAAQSSFTVSGTQVLMRARIRSDADRAARMTRVVFILTAADGALEGYVVLPLDDLVLQPGDVQDVSTWLLLSGARDAEPASLRLSVVAEAEPAADA
jgi:hypothetical protein